MFFVFSARAQWGDLPHTSSDKQINEGNKHADGKKNPDTQV